VQLPGERDTLTVYSARSGRGDSALELCLRHHGRHDAGFDRQRQHCSAEALERFADDCGEVHGTAGRMRHARRRGELLPRRRRELWRRAGGTSEDSLHRFHRIARSWIAHQPDCRTTATRPDLDQAHGARNGRQGRHHRRRRRRSRFGGRRRGAGGFRISGPEVLGLFARYCRRAYLRHVPRETEIAGRAHHHGRSRPPTRTWRPSSTKVR
jgi:hypothetical protein